MSGTLTAPTPRIMLNDASGRLWVLATETVPNSGDNAQVVQVGIGAFSSPALYESVGTTIAAGGTAQNAFESWDEAVRYIVVQNPPDAASQGIATAENLFVKLDGAAVVNGATNFAVLSPGQSVTIGMPGLRPDATLTVSVNAATTNHKYLCTIIYVP